MKLYDTKSQEALLINELLESDPVRWDEVRQWELWDFLGKQVLPKGGGFDDQDSPDMASLRKVSFIFSVAQEILRLRDERTQQYNDLLKMAKIAEVA